MLNFDSLHSTFVPSMVCRLAKKIMKKIVKDFLHLSSKDQNSFHFDEIFCSLKITIFATPTMYLAVLLKCKK